MADYGGVVLWRVDPSNIGAIDLDKLELTDDLKGAIQEWAEAYDRTLNQDYPPDSGFADSLEEEAFEQEGVRLWRQLQAQLGPDWSVNYYSTRDRMLFE